LDRLWRLLLIILTRISVCLLLASLRVTSAVRITCAVILAPCVLHDKLKKDGRDGRGEGIRWAGGGKKMGRLRELNKEERRNVGGQSFAFLRALEYRDSSPRAGVRNYGTLKAR
jgi:hypothetical protein